MALNDEAVITAAKGYVFDAPVGTASPTPADIQNFDPSSLEEDWKDLGHTARGELPEFGFEGGETENRGTWRNAVLKVITTEVASDYVTFNLQQWDKNALSFYYASSNSASAAEGEFIVTEASSSATKRALLIVIVDGDVSLAFYAPKADIRREDAMTLAVDEFGTIPLRASFLQYDDGAGNLELFRWISLDTGVNPAPLP